MSQSSQIKASTVHVEVFVGKNVAKALGYSNSRDALSKHVDSEDKGVAKCDTLRGKLTLTIINDSGLYLLILSSKLPQTRSFKRGVTSEVLPQIWLIKTDARHWAKVTL